MTLKWIEVELKLVTSTECDCETFSTSTTSVIRFLYICCFAVGCSTDPQNKKQMQLHRLDEKTKDRTAYVKKGGRIVGSERVRPDELHATLSLTVRFLKSFLSSFTGLILLGL